MGFTPEEKKAYAIKKKHEQQNELVHQALEKFELAERLADEADLELSQLMRQMNIEMYRYKKTPIDFSQKHWWTKYDTEEDKDFAEQGRVIWYNKQTIERGQHD